VVVFDIGFIKGVMMEDIVYLDKSIYQGYKETVTYETDSYFGLMQLENHGGFAFDLIEKKLPNKVSKSFVINLYPDYFPDAEAYGVFASNRLIGLIEISYEGWNNRLRITELWVDLLFRHKGIGTKLMEHAQLIARKKNARAVILETQTTNIDAIKFYLSQGFQVLGVDLGCYGNHDVESKEIRLELWRMIE